MNRLMAGALSGAIATVPMSALMLIWRALSPTGELPPRRITRRVLRQTKLHDDADPTAVATIAHFAFGAVSGVAYAMLRGLLPRGVPALASGTVAGMGIWGASYVGWIPALKFLPPPDRDRPARQRMMVAAHVVFGAAMGLLVARLTARSQS
ncbi:MAG: DUF6789 family protein [Candidatus Limnocylindria bacterium]